MINPKSYEAPWLKERGSALLGKDPSLVEKVVRALVLLESLVDVGLEFVFKGGTALMLVLNELNRFSIDIDILMSKKPEDLSSRLDEVSKKGGFLHWEKNERVQTRKIPKEHYKFFFKPADPKRYGGDPGFILLDVVYGAPPYAKIEDHGIDSDFLIVDGTRTKVAVPSFEGLLADKLSAFAPNTTGIPLKEGRALSIAKQLYDISRLFDARPDIAGVLQDFEKLVPIEASYRGKEVLTSRDVLNDIFQTAAIIAHRGREQKETHAELSEGILRLAGFLFQRTATAEESIEWAGKAAYLSRCLAGKPISTPRMPPEIKNLKDLEIPLGPFSKFNRFKKFRPDGFYYWHQALELERALQG